MCSLISWYSILMISVKSAIVRMGPWLSATTTALWSAFLYFLALLSFLVTLSCLPHWCQEGTPNSLFCGDETPLNITVHSLTPGSFINLLFSRVGMAWSGWCCGWNSPFPCLFFWKLSENKEQACFASTFQACSILLRGKACPFLVLKAHLALILKLC